MRDSADEGRAWPRKRAREGRKHPRAATYLPPCRLLADGMRTRLRHLVEKLRTSLWLVPAVLTLAAVGLAAGLLWLDSALPPHALPQALAFSAGAEAAQSLLTTVAGAISAWAASRSPSRSSR